jgi:hypothetical protein
MIDVVLFGYDIPLWIVFLAGIIILVIAWKLIKFALKLLLIIALFFIILMVLDYADVFNTIQNLISGII